MKRHMIHFCTAANERVMLLQEQAQMSDCGCDQLEKHVEILKEILTTRKTIEGSLTSTRVNMLMRMIGNELKTSDAAKKAVLRKELIQAAAACIMHLETL